MAVKWHPDKNPGNEEEATRMFKLVAEAYEVLGNEEKRAMYDRYGRPGNDNSSASRGGADPFSAFFSGASAGRRGNFHVDPFEIFRQFFGEDDDFAGFLPRRNGNDRPFRGRGSSNEDPFGFGSMGGGFESMMRGGGSSMTFSSMSSMGGGGGVSRSTSSQTVIQNGQRVTRTTTTIRHADGRVETTTDESVGSSSDGANNNRLGGDGGRSGARWPTSGFLSGF